MQIQTKHLGEIEVNDKDIIQFKHGLPGFPEYKQFIVVGFDGGVPFAMLQSTEEVEVGFVVAYPFAFKQDYAFDLSEEDKEELAIADQDEVITYAVVTLKETLETSTINLLAPVVINITKKLGKQIVLRDQNAYPLQYKLGVLSGSEL